MFRFETLEVWKKSVKLCDLALSLADKLPSKFQFSLGDQLRRSAISISTNIAEGSGRKNKKEANQFYNIAKASCYEVVNLVMIIRKRNLISVDNYRIIYKDAEEICKMLSGLMRI